MLLWEGRVFPDVTLEGQDVPCCYLGREGCSLMLPLEGKMFPEVTFGGQDVPAISY